MKCWKVEGPLVNTKEEQEKVVESKSENLCLYTEKSDQFQA